MKIIITIFSMFFLIQYYQYSKIKRKIRASEDYSKLYRNYVKCYTVYNNLFMENKFKNCPVTVKYLKNLFEIMDILNKYHNFKDINYELSKTKSYKRKERKSIIEKKEFQNFTKEIKLFTPEIENLFKEIIDLQVFFLKSTNKTLYYLYVYNVKIRTPFLLGILKYLIIFLRILITHLKKIEEQQEYLKVAKENKKLEECFI